jgi:hypothetical protein
VERCMGERFGRAAASPAVALSIATSCKPPPAGDPRASDRDITIWYCHGRSHVEGSSA